MLRVGLREHHQLDIGRVAAERAKTGVEIIDFVGCEREPQRRVRALERDPSVREQRNRRQRFRREMREQLPRIVAVDEHRLDHPVVQQRQQRGAILAG